MAIMTPAQIQAELKRKAAAGIAPTNAANQAQYNKIKPPTPVIAGAGIALMNPNASSPSSFNTTLGKLVQGSTAGVGGIGGQTGTGKTPNNTTTPDAKGAYFDKNFGGLGNYQTNQQKRYDEAQAAGDTDLINRLKADAARVGYNLQDAAPPAVVGQGQGQDNTNQGNYAQYTPQTDPRFGLGYGEQQINDLNALAKQQAEAGAYGARNQADVVSAQNAQRLNEMMANQGLNASGENITAQLGQAANRQNALNDVNSQLAGNLSNLDANTAQQLLSNLYRNQDVDYRNQTFDWQKQTDIANLLGQLNGQQTMASIGQQADLTGLVNGNKTYAAQQQDIANQAQYGGTFGGNKTVQQAQQDWENRFNFGQAIGKFGSGQQTLAAKGQQFEQDLAGKQWNAQEKQQIFDNNVNVRNFEEDKRQFGLQYALQNNAQAMQQDDNLRQWASLDFEQQSSGMGGGGQSIPPAAAGNYLQGLVNRTTTDILGKSKTTPVTDPAEREQSFLDAYNQGVAPGADAVEMLVRAGYTPAEIAKYKDKYKEIFQGASSSGGGSSSGNVKVPQKLQGLSTQLASKYNVDAKLIDAVAQQESGYGGASQNVMQVNGMNKSTPEQSMEVGSRMLGNLVNKYGTEWGLASYNMGQGIIGYAKKNGITDPRQAMASFSSYMKKKNGYKVYGDVNYLDNVMKYYG